MPPSVDTLPRTRAEWHAHYRESRRRIERPVHGLASTHAQPDAPVSSRPAPRAWPWVIVRRDAAVGHDANQHVCDWAYFQSLRRFHPCRAVIIATARYFDLDESDITGQRRTANVVRPRQIAFWIMSACRRYSLPEMGRRVGGRDHTTVLHGVRTIERLKPDSPEITKAIAAIHADLTMAGALKPVEVAS